MNKLIVLSGTIFFFVFIFVNTFDNNSTVTEITLTDNPELKIKLGKELFFNNELSNPVGQSCSSYHNPNTGFSEPGHKIVSGEAMTGRFANGEMAMINKYSWRVSYAEGNPRTKFK